MSFGKQKRECVDCKYRFTAFSPLSIRCPKCAVIYKDKLKKNNNRRYREKNRQKINEYLRNYYKDNKIIIGKPVRICPICNIEFISDSNHQKYYQSCRVVTVKKIYRSKQIGKNNNILSNNYYKNIESNRLLSKERYYIQTKNPETRLRQIKSGASKRGLEFEISLDWYLDNGWNNNCYYCGSKTQNGLDRLNNNIGYTENNCVPCCINCNKAKSILSKDEFLEMCLNVVKNLKLI